LLRKKLSIRSFGVPPEGSALQLAQRLLILTLALGEAAARGDHGEIAALFAERGKLLAVLETAETNQEVLNVLRQVQVAENEAMLQFQRGKASAVREMEKGLHGRKVPHAYASRSGVRSFDSQG
jgi:hypothetical protein